MKLFTKVHEIQRPNTKVKQRADQKSKVKTRTNERNQEPKAGNYGREEDGEEERCTAERHRQQDITIRQPRHTVRCRHSCAHVQKYGQFREYITFVSVFLKVAKILLAASAILQHNALLPWWCEALLLHTRSSMQITDKGWVPHTTPHQETRTITLKLLVVR